MLLDEGNEFGGALLSTSANNASMDFISSSLSTLEKNQNVRLLKRTTATGYYDYNYITAIEKVTDHLGPGAGGDAPRQRFWKIRAKQVVIAAGSIERPLVFADNDRPGIMLANAVGSYMNRYGVLPGDNVVVFTNNDSAYQVALDAAAKGATVTTVDTRRNVPAVLKSALDSNNIRLFEGCLLYTSPSPRDGLLSRMPSSA